MLNLTSSSRTEHQVAGSKHILVIRNTQGSDYGSYMCYATNSIGSTQKMIDVKAEDRSNKELAYSEENTSEASDGDKPLESVDSAQFTALKKQLERQRRLLGSFKKKIEKELKEMKAKQKRRGGSGSGSDAVSMNGDNFYEEVDRLEELFLTMKQSFDSFGVKFTMMERNSQDETLRIWDNLHDLQELSNVTSKTLEEMYDKDIITLQQFQNVAQEELKRIKKELMSRENGEVVQYESPNNDHFDDRFRQLQDAIQMMRNSNKINQNLFQSFRSDLNRAFVDIDDMKKFRQKTLMKMEIFNRLVGRIQVDLFEETITKVNRIEGQISNMEKSISKTSQRLRKLNNNSSGESGDDEKVTLLLKEIQNMKTQMFFLQQSILQMRTQEHLALEVTDGDVGPAYNDELSADVARLKTEMEMLLGRFQAVESGVLDQDGIPRSEFDIRNNALVERIDGVEDKVDNARIVADACEAASNSVRRDIAQLTSSLEKVVCLICPIHIFSDITSESIFR